MLRGVGGHAVFEGLYEASTGMVFKYSTFMIETFRQNGFVKLNFKLYPLFQKKI